MNDVTDAPPTNLQPNWKQRIGGAILLIAIIVPLYLGTGLLWAEYRKIVLLATVAAFPFKIVLLWLVSNKVFRGVVGCQGIGVTAILVAGIAFLFLIFDTQLLPLWADQLGRATTAQITRLTIKSRNSRFVTYQYAADQETYSFEQEVTGQLFDKLYEGQAIDIRYLPDLPQIACLFDDGGYMRLPAALSLAVALWAPLGFFQDEIAIWLQRKMISSR